MYNVILQFNAIWALCCLSIHCIKCRFRGICVWMLNVEYVRLVPFIPIYYPLWRDIMNKIINEFELHSIEQTQLDRWPAFSRRFFTTEESYMGIVFVPACIFALCVAVVVVDVGVCVCVCFLFRFYPLECQYTNSVLDYLQSFRSSSLKCWCAVKCTENVAARSIHSFLN